MIPALALVAVLVYAPPSGQAVGERARAEAALQAALGGQSLVGADRVVEAARQALRDGWVAEAKLQFFAEGHRLAEEGARALERVELERAVELYGQAEAIYERALAWPGTAARLADAALARGVALFELKRGDEAGREWRRAASLDPVAQLTEARVRPDVVRAFRDAVGAGVPRAELPPLPAPSPEALDRLPEPAAVTALGEALGVDEVWAAAIAIDRGQPTIVARRLSARGCGTDAVAASAGGFEAAARAVVERLRHAEERCPAPPAALVDAEPIVHPRPPVSAAEGIAHRRKLRLYEQPWLWAGVLAGSAVVVGLAVGLAPRSTTVEVDVNGAPFTPSR